MVILTLPKDTADTRQCFSAMLHCPGHRDVKSRGTVVLWQRLISVAGRVPIPGHQITVGQECPTYIASVDIALVPV